MSHITLIRHGQANSDARDELSYDRLSPLGHQQAQWLGAYMNASQAFHPRVYCGTLVRHRQTAEGMGVSDAISVDARLNELEYFTLAQLYEAQHGVAVPTDREGFAQYFPDLFTAWSDGRLEGAPESFANFRARVTDALDDIAGGDGPALVVTSGGVVAMAMSSAMALDLTVMARLALAIMNTSMHRVFPMGGTLAPVLFNAVPHLDHPDRHYAQTHM